jgi:hypothetical protein
MVPERIIKKIESRIFNKESFFKKEDSGKEILENLKRHQLPMSF